MRILLLLAGAAGMALTAPIMAKPPGGGGGGGGGQGQGAQRGGGGGGQQARGGGGPRQEARGGGGGGQARGGGPRMQRGGGGQQARGGGPRMERGGGPQQVRGGGSRMERGGGQQQARGGGPRMETRGGGRGNAERRVERPERGDGGNRERRQEQRAQFQPFPRSEVPQQIRQGGGRGNGAVQREARRTERRPVQVTEAANVARLQWDESFPGVRGCPPGLARRNNGCMPPGLARQQAAQQTWYDSWWGYPQQNTDYFYDEGYLYQLGNGGSVAGYIPLLGGALWPGQAWPSSFDGYPVPDYHVDYFGLEQGYDYRLADGAVYGVDPQSQAIQQVVALVTGDDWNIGQQMPEGYDIYNVPYEYRDQYADDHDSMYRYSDGYVYQMDPTTQLIQAAIQLIT